MRTELHLLFEVTVGRKSEINWKISFLVNQLLIVFCKKKLITTRADVLPLRVPDVKLFVTATYYCV